MPPWGTDSDAGGTTIARTTAPLSAAVPWGNDNNDWTTTTSTQRHTNAPAAPPLIVRPWDTDNPTPLMRAHTTANAPVAPPAPPPPTLSAPVAGRTLAAEHLQHIRQPGRRHVMAEITKGAARMRLSSKSDFRAPAPPWATARRDSVKSPRAAGGNGRGGGGGGAQTFCARTAEPKELTGAFAYAQRPTGRHIFPTVDASAARGDVGAFATTWGDGAPESELLAAPHGKAQPQKREVTNSGANGEQQTNGASAYERSAVPWASEADRADLSAAQRQVAYSGHCVVLELAESELGALESRGAPDYLRIPAAAVDSLRNPLLFTPCVNPSVGCLHGGEKRRLWELQAFVGQGRLAADSMLLELRKSGLIDHSCAVDDLCC